MLIEVNQYIWKLGYAEIDDIINNTMGILLGVAVVINYKKYCLKNKKCII
ncbi:VanZ family protein [[Ruminococcus] lactaris]